MIKDVYMVDKEGYYIDFVKINEESKMYYTDSFKWSDIDFEFVEITPPIMCQPKWNGKAWEEGASPEELRLWQQPNQPRSSLKKIIKSLSKKVYS